MKTRAIHLLVGAAVLGMAQPGQTGLFIYNLVTGASDSLPELAAHFRRLTSSRSHRMS